MTRRRSPPASLRELSELAESEWAEQWSATREVSDRNGGTVRLPGLPWHFSANDGQPGDQLPALQGEHNDEVLRELGYDDADILELHARDALVEPSRGLRPPEPEHPALEPPAGEAELSRSQPALASP